jgi:diaminopimelate decarboxylase
MNKKIQTPYFLISQDKLEKNINDFFNALYALWPNSILSYSVKTNSLPWVIQYMCKKDILAEVVSDEEYELAQMCGYQENRIIFNGPIKSKKSFQRAVNRKSIVNIDSKNDLDALLEMDRTDISNIGIRINVNSDVFMPEDIGYAEDGFRFGFSEENGELKKVIHMIRNKFGDCSFGLHLHCNSVTRSPNVYSAIAKYAGAIVKKYQLTPSFIDVGGGFFGGVEGKPTAVQYISLIADELQKTVDACKTKLIIEPGSAIIGSVVELHTSVLDVKDTMRARIVTTDGSRIHIDPLWAKKQYMYSVDAQKEKKHPKQIICGYTCMDHDRLMVLENEKELSVGDEIVYHRVGAYSMTFGGMFIRYLPEVYVESDGAVNKVRNRIAVKEYYSIQSVN